MASEPHAGTKLEPPGVDLRGVLLAGFGAMLLLVGAIAGLDAYYRSQVPSRALPPPQTFSEPRLRADENAELRRLQAEQERQLSAYAWVDRAHGVVRIPIERAMQLIVAAGPKAYDPIAPSADALASPTAGAQRAMSGQGASPASPPSAPPPRSAAEPKP
jgi:hypothetical protein